MARAGTKPCAAALRASAVEGFRHVELGDHAASLADEECRGLALMGMRAGDKGVAAFDLVDEAMGQEEIERAIDGDGRRPRPLAPPCAR